MAIITISRGTHSGGKSVGESLASKLGYPCLSREEIIREASIDFDIPEEELNATMAEPPRFWQQVPSKRIAHMNFLRTTLVKHFENGNLVYHGYAAHLLLGKSIKVLRVRINADKEYRIMGAMKDLNISRREAIKGIDRVDRQNAKWARALYGIDWNDPSLYDLVVNLQQISMESIVETLAFMTTLDDFIIDEQAMKAIDDLSLSSKVRSALSKNPRTTSAKLFVDAEDGEITLEGQVSSGKILNAILEETKSQPGVSSIKHDIKIGIIEYSLSPWQ